MKTHLYLTNYEKEIIKNEIFYKLSFFDTINGLVFITHIHENSLIENYIDLINAGTPKTIENLKKELLNDEKNS